MLRSVKTESPFATGGVGGGHDALKLVGTEFISGSGAEEEEADRAPSTVEFVHAAAGEQKTELEVLAVAGEVASRKAVVRCVH